MSLCGFLDRLEQAGLVQRAPDPDDRRAKRVHLTDAAGPVLDQIAAIGAEMRTLARAGMSDTEWETFAAAARLVRDNLTRAREARCSGGAS